MDGKAAGVEGSRGGRSYLAGSVRAALFAAGGAAVVNGVLYLGGDVLGAFPETATVPRRGGPLTLAPVVALSLMAPLMGMGIYILLSRFTRRAFGLFLALAAAVLVFMAFPPFEIEGAPVLQVILLQVMHLVTAGATLLAVNRVRRASWDRDVDAV
jgi:hypothetical protein